MVVLTYSLLEVVGWSLYIFVPQRATPYVRALVLRQWFLFVKCCLASKKRIRSRQDLEHWSVAHRLL